jgi:hypothetical protein
LPGSPDDRWVFTEENPRRELQTAAALAAGARALKGYNDDLAARSLKAAIAIYDRAKPQDELRACRRRRRCCSHNGTRSTAAAARADAMRSRKHRARRLVVGRTLPLVQDEAYTKDDRDASPAIAQGRTSSRRRRRTACRTSRTSGARAGTSSASAGTSGCCTCRSRICSAHYALQALSFILGVHPGSNTASFVSGVGAKSLTTAYGFNRADWSYIPGGSASGTALIRPDFPELKHWPFFWQQTEYVLGRGTTDYLLLVLAADHVLNQPRRVSSRAPCRG